MRSRCWRCSRAIRCDQQCVEPGPLLEPYVQDALDEIEFLTGDAKTSYWGGQRAKCGHAEPFHLTYVEIGNEDYFDQSGSYDARFTQFYDAFKAKYPQLQLIATSREAKTRTPDLYDDHYYRNADGFYQGPSALRQGRPQGAEGLRGRMGHAGGQADAEFPGRAGRRRLDDEHGTQLRPDRHALLCAAVRQRQSGRHAVENRPHRLQRPGELRFARLLRPGDVRQPHRQRHAEIGPQGRRRACSCPIP